MNRKLTAITALLTWLILSILPVCADSIRINMCPDYPARRLAKQFNSTTESVYRTGDPNTGNLTTTTATGRVPKDGLVTVAFSAGFTPPLAVSAWWYNANESKWIHCGAAAAEYTKSIDATYTMTQFTAPPDAAFLITADAAVTGNVYVSGKAHKDNANSATGYDY